MIGIISLVGIVVNDAIVMIETMNGHRQIGDCSCCGRFGLRPCRMMKYIPEDVRLHGLLRLYIMIGPVTNSTGVH